MSNDDLSVMMASRAKVLAQIVDMVSLLASKQDTSMLQASMQQVLFSMTEINSAIYIIGIKGQHLGDFRYCRTS